MTTSKRVFDISLALILLVLLAPVLLGVALFLLLREGRPVFYISKRMKTPEVAFRLIKFRTMRHVAHDVGVSGGDKSDRVTVRGAFLRRTRLDELPQLWNILRGDMSFVGPRPPLRLYVDRFPDLYGQVLRSRPGVTGLASLVFHRHEEWILKSCATAEETDAAYARRCVPRKARLDLLYQKSSSLCFDIMILLKTLGVPLSRHKAGVTGVASPAGPQTVSRLRQKTP